VMKVIWNDWLRRAAESDLIRNDNAESLLAEHVDGRGPVLSEKVHSVKQNNRAAISLAFWRNIHVSHSHVLSVEGHRQIRHGIRIRHVFHVDAAGFDVGWSRRRLRLRSFLPRKSRHI